jgi:hypothetical protein
MMDLTEYWATLVSIVLGLGMADLLLNFLRLVHERKRVDWDFLPLVWAVVALGWIINYWWAVAANLDGSRDAQVVAAFVLLLIVPILIFMMSASVLPRAIPAEGRLNMRVEWASTRQVFLIFFMLNQIATWVRVLSVRPEITWDTASLTRTVTLGILVALLFVKDRRAEWVGVLVILGLMSFRLATQPVR